MIRLLSFYPFLAGLFALCATPAVLVYGSWANRRAMRRNEHGKCARCGATLDHSDRTSDLLIQGRAVCNDCADRFARRLSIAVPALAVTASVATGWALLRIVPYMWNGRGIDAASVLGALAPAAGLLYVYQGVKARMRMVNEVARLQAGPLTRLPSAPMPEFLARTRKVPHHQVKR